MDFNDWLAAIFCSIMCLSCLGLHIITSPKHRTWPSVPWPVRWGFLMAGCGLMYRTIDLFKLSHTPGNGAAGHIDFGGDIASGVMCYMLLSLVIYEARRRYSYQIWDGLRHFEGLAKSDPTGASSRLAMRGATVVGANAREMPPAP